MLITDRLTTPPAEEPITISELKAHLRITSDEEDTELAGYIASAREYYEGQTGRALVTQSRTAAFDEFPVGGGAVTFGRVPLTSVDAVKYLDGDLVERTLGGSAYYADMIGEPGSISLRPGQSWPATATVSNAVRVEYTCGTEAASVSAVARQAILFLAAHFFENRVPVNVGNIVSEIPLTLQAMIWSDRIH